MAIPIIPTNPLPAYLRDEAALRKIGWRIEEAFADLDTGRIRVKVSTLVGVNETKTVVTLDRSSWKSRTVVMRDAAEYRQGFAKGDWEIEDHIGSSRFEYLEEAWGFLLDYVVDNNPVDGLDGPSAVKILSASTPYLPRCSE